MDGLDWYMIIVILAVLEVAVFFGWMEFEVMMDKAISDGAIVFTCVGDQDLPIPEEFLK